MRALRIAMISTPFVAVPPPGYGGTELVVHELVEGLIERGHHVTLFATGDSRTSSELRYLYDKAQWPPQPLVELNHVSWAMAQIEDGQFDVVHAHATLALGMTRLVRNGPLIYTIHHVRSENHSAFYQQFPDQLYVAISHKQKLREVPLSHCEVIHHGLDPGRFGPVQEPEDYVCFVARLSKIKGPHIAINAAEAAGMPIRIAGEPHGEDREFFESELKQLLSKPHVTALGGIGSPQKEELLRSARALLFPVTWDEPFGLVMIEAMLSGCPVVAFEAGSVPEVVENGVTGFIVSSAEEMADVIRRGGRLEGFDRQRCRERAVERFSRDRLVRDHLGLYEKAISRRSS